MRTPIGIAMLAALALALAACAEKTQTAGTRNPDVEAWKGAQDANVAPGWTPGDKTSWQHELRDRMQGQNEYARIAPQPKS